MKTMTRRNVITTMSAATAVVVCPAALIAQTVEWAGGVTPPSDSESVGFNQIVELSAGETQVDIAALMPGDVAVVARPTDDVAYQNIGFMQKIAVHRRTADQMAAASDGAEYYVANLACPHRGFAISVSNDPARPFACNKQGGRHGSVFDANGFGVAGASKDKSLIVPAHELHADGDSVVLTLT